MLRIQFERSSHTGRPKPPRPGISNIFDLFRTVYGISTQTAGRTPIYPRLTLSPDLYTLPSL